MNKDFPPGFNENQIAIDFDGVIHNHDKGYYDGTIYGNPMTGSYEALKKLSKKIRFSLIS